MNIDNVNIGDIVLFECDIDEIYISKVTHKSQMLRNDGMVEHILVVKAFYDGIPYVAAQESILELLPKRNTKAYRERVMLLKLEGNVK